MKRKNQRTRQAGTALVEASLTLMIYCMMVFMMFDFGYIMYLHQTIVDRTRAAARYGSLNPTDTTGMKNIVLYYNTTGSGNGIFGLTTSNVSATRTGSGTLADRVTVSVYGFSYFAVWPGQATTGKAITVSIPVENN